MTTQHISTLTSKFTTEASEDISERMDFIYESNPHLSDNMYPDDKDHYFEFLKNYRYGG